MATYFITGGRGIGLELATQLAKRPANEVALILITTRGQPSGGLATLMQQNERVVHIACNVSDQESVDQAAIEAAKTLNGKGLDILVNNAGVMPATLGGIEDLKEDVLNDAFNTNVMGTQRVTAAFLPLLRKGQSKRIINISTTLGSIAYASRYTHAPTAAYKITKAALNMLTVQWALDYGKDGFTVVALSPGYLQTELAGEFKADLDVTTGVRAVVEAMDNITHADNGEFLNIYVPGWENAEGPNQYDGKNIPW